MTSISQIGPSENEQPLYFESICSATNFMKALWKNEKPNKSQRVKWTQDEDQKLSNLVSTYGPKNWKQIAKYFSIRSGKQCRERYLFQLDPTIMKGPWSAEEDNILIEKQKEFGNQWTKIVPFLEGRTSISIKNRYQNILTHQNKKNTILSRLPFEFNPWNNEVDALLLPESLGSAVSIDQQKKVSLTIYDQVNSKRSTVPSVMKSTICEEIFTRDDIQLFLDNIQFFPHEDFQ